MNKIEYEYIEFIVEKGSVFNRGSALKVWMVNEFYYFQ